MHLKDATKNPPQHSKIEQNMVIWYFIWPELLINFTKIGNRSIVISERIVRNNSFEEEVSF